MSRTEIKRVVPRKAGVLVAVVAALMTVGTAFAVHDSTPPGVGPMELDGNIADANPGVDPRDWGAMFGANGLQTADVPAGTLDTTDVIQDFEPGETGPDDTYHEPSNKDDQAIDPDSAGNVWACVSAQNPTDKTDIVNAYGAAIQGDAETGDGDTADDQLFYFGVERFDNSGDAFIGLWLFQDDVGCTADGKFQGSKRTGDVLVLANFTGGGSTATVQLFRYTAGAGDAAGTFTQFAASGKCEATAEGDLAFPQNDICATLNDEASIATPWAMEDKQKPGPPSPDVPKTLEPDQFVEGGVNLTDIFLGASGGGTPPPCFGSFLAETRSSSSLDATLKDYALGDLNFCNADISIGDSETNRVSESHTFTVDVDQLIGSGTGPALVGDVEYTLTGGGGIEDGDIVVTGGTCINDPDNFEDDLDANGQCTIIFNSAVAGTVTAHATVEVNVGGSLLTRETDGEGSNSGDAVKTYVDATLDITGDGTNRVGASHSFTATLLADDGDGPQPVVGHTVTIQKTDTNAVSVPAGNQTCVTDANGQCSVSFTSNSTGTTTGTASADDVPAGSLLLDLTSASDATIAANQSVLKTWVDASLDITGDGTNRVGASHSFTATLLADAGDGTGPQPVVGHTITIQKTDANGAVSDPAGNQTCVTDANGQCSVSFTSNATGTTTGTALANDVGSLLLDLTSGADATIEANQSVLKTWVDARIGIAGADTDGITEQHTFTVTVEKDLGGPGGFGPAAGEDVNVTLVNAGAVYQINETLTTCDVIGTGATFDHANPDTNASGQCIVVFTSNVAGTVTGSAAASVDLGGGVTANVSTSDTGSTGNVIKTFVSGSLVWHKNDNHGNRLEGATFEICRTSHINTATDPDSYVEDNPDVCFSVTDNDATDEDPADGDFLVSGKVLGAYTARETAAPAGYHIDNPLAVAFDAAMTIADPNIEIATPFTNSKAFRLIAYTCDDISHLLVVSEVDLDGDGNTAGDIQSTISAAEFTALGWQDADGDPLSQAEFCSALLPGANYGPLDEGTYNPSILIPQ